MGSDLHVEANGARFAVTVEGDGPAVVLLHAGVADRRMWVPVAALLRDDRRVVTFDLRGFGDTDVGDAPFAHHADVLALVDGLDLVRPVLAGSSFGGKVALEAAVVAPERFSRLVLFAPPLPGHEWSERAEEFDAAESAALEAGDIDRAVAVNVELWAAGLGAAERDLVAAMQRRAFELQLAAEVEPEALEPPVTERLAAIAMPTDILVGDRDLPDFLAIGRRLESRIPGARLTVVPGAGHLIALHDPELAARAIRGFV